MAARVALLYPGDAGQRERAEPRDSRYWPLFEALAAAGVEARAVIWNEEFEAEVEAELLQGGFAALQCWCNPIEQGRDRSCLDALLRRVAAATGMRVSAHPETILRLGTKELLWRVQDLPFGSDCQRIADAGELNAELLQRLARGPRVLKAWRGHSGIGVWRLDAVDRGLLLQPAQRGAAALPLADLAALRNELAPWFEGHRPLFDQAWQPAVATGMLRAYLVGRQVVGFGMQAVVALDPLGREPSPRLYHDADWAPGQALRQRLEQGGWLDELGQRFGLAEADWPLLWDADFFLLDEPGRYQLCEINVSSVSPFPPSAIPPLVSALAGLAAGR